MGYFDSYDNEALLWINGVIIEEPGSIYRYFHALPEPLLTECPVSDWEEQLIVWQRQFPGAESGQSGLRPEVLTFLTRLKVAVFESAQLTVEWTQQRAEWVHEVLSQSPFDIGVGYVRKAACILDAMIKAVALSELPIICWGHPASEIQKVYALITPAFVEAFIQLPHIQTAMNAETFRAKQMTRLANRREAEFNKWLKLQKRTQGKANPLPNWEEGSESTSA